MSDGSFSSGEGYTVSFIGVQGMVTRILLVAVCIGMLGDVVMSDSAHALTCEPSAAVNMPGDDTSGPKRLRLAVKPRTAGDYPPPPGLVAPAVSPPRPAAEVSRVWPKPGPPPKTNESSSGLSMSSISSALSIVATPFRMITGSFGSESESEVSAVPPPGCVPMTPPIKARQ